ncbi:hypothetical protein DPQ22_06725 [Candidatus Tokpelaia sp.]|nr:hypothetical protein DPQ22_06725 [Candidatus Tokpelaia sp.]
MEISPADLAKMGEATQRERKAAEALPGYKANRTTGDFFRQNGGINGLPMPAPVKIDNKADMTIKILGGQAEVSGRFNGEPINAVDSGRMIARP